MSAQTQEIFSGARGNSRTRRLLVVDDEPLICWSLGQRLTDAGYEVVEAADAASALENFQNGKTRVDLVLLDVRLPDVDGVSVLRQIKNVRPGCPVIMMTAFGTPEKAVEAMTSGAYCVVNKPFSLADMAGLIEEALVAANG